MNRVDWDTVCMAEWISTAMAVLSGIGAAWAWWQANLSGKARERAEAAERQACEELRQMQEQTDSLKRLAEAFEQQVKQAQGPALKVARGPRMNSSPRLVNTSQREVQVEELLNRDAFVRIDGLETPFILAPGEARELRAIGALGKPVPPTLHLRLGDGNELHVQL